MSSRHSPDEDRGEFESTWTAEATGSLTAGTAADGSLTDGTAADGPGPFEAAVEAERRCFPLLTFSILNNVREEILSERKANSKVDKITYD